MDFKGKSFLKLLDFTPDEIDCLIDLASELKQKKNNVSEAAKNLLDSDNEEDMKNVIILDEFSKSKNDNIKKQIKDFEQQKEDQKNKIKLN